MKEISALKVIIIFLKQEGLTIKDVCKELDISLNDVSIMTLIVHLFKNGFSREGIVNKLCLSLEEFDEKVKTYFINLPYTEAWVDISEDNKYVLMMKVADLDISVRTLDLLRFADVEYIWQLISFQEEDLLKFRGLGRKKKDELHDLVEKLGLKFGTSFTESQIETLRLIN